jgi:hypothetical protein
MLSTIILNTTANSAQRSGIYEICLPAAEPTRAPKTIHIMTDVSGSMDERCSDKNSKLDQIKHVTKNIIRFIANNCANITLQVSTFNSIVTVVIEPEIVTKDNQDEMIRKIEMMDAMDMTDIEKAIRSVKFGNIGAEQHNILMTDGDANIGETRANELVKLVDIGASNTFIGFGLEHNPHMITTLANTRNGAYYFIDQLERSGVAYGEILHGIVHRVYKSARLIVENGEVYDWKTNTWTNEVYIGGLAADTKKRYHIQTDDPNKICVRFMDDDVEVEKTVFHGQFEDLTQMEYRYRTLEMLFRATQMSSPHRNAIYTLHAQPAEAQPADASAKPLDASAKPLDASAKPLDASAKPLDASAKPLDASAKPQAKPTIRDLKIEMKNLVAEMTTYMETLDDKRLMKNLCDDIVVVYRTIGTRYGHMYSCARQCSQGTERIHTASNTPMAPREDNCDEDDRDSVFGEEDPDSVFELTPRPRFGRSLFAPKKQRDPLYEDDEFNNYMVSDEAETPHSSRTATALINEISITDEDCENNYSLTPP